MSRFMVKDTQDREVVLRDNSGEDIDLCLDYRGNGQMTKLDFKSAQTLAYDLLDMIPDSHKICSHCRDPKSTNRCQCWNDE